MTPHFFKKPTFSQADRAGGRGGGQRGKKRPAAAEEDGGDGGDSKVGRRTAISLILLHCEPKQVIFLNSPLKILGGGDGFV